MGNTEKALEYALDHEDHPHLCGEHVHFLIKMTAAEGSPPPVWGTPEACEWIDENYRITPTCVGNTANFTLRGV